jgi:hypothetical protein
MNACFNSMRLLAYAVEGGANVAVASAKIAIEVLYIFAMTMLQCAQERIGARASIYRRAPLFGMSGCKWALTS